MDKCKSLLKWMLYVRSDGVYFKLKLHLKKIYAFLTCVSNAWLTLSKGL